MRQEASEEHNLLITHHLSHPARKTRDVADLIESFGEWIEIEPSIYVLWTRLPRLEVLEGIRRFVHKRDKLAVIDLSGRLDRPQDLLALAAH